MRSQNPWLRRFASSGGADPRGKFDSVAMMSKAWTLMTRSGEYTTFDCVTKLVALEKLWPVVSSSSRGAGASRSTTSPALQVCVFDESKDLSEAQLKYTVDLAQMGMVVGFVGDAMQGIYGFRGADGRACLRLANKLLPSGATVGVRTLPLTTCFRCAEVVVGAANLVLNGKANSEQRDEFVPYTLRPADGAPVGGFCCSQSRSSSSASGRSRRSPSSSSPGAGAPSSRRRSSCSPCPTRRSCG